MDALTEQLIAARRLTLTLAELEKKVQAAHEERGRVLLEVKRLNPELTNTDIAAAIGVNRQRAWTLVRDAKAAERKAAEPAPADVVDAA